MSLMIILVQLTFIFLNFMFFEPSQYLARSWQSDRQSDSRITQWLFIIVKIRNLEYCMDLLREGRKMNDIVLDDSINDLC